MRKNVSTIFVNKILKFVESKYVNDDYQYKIRATVLIDNRLSNF